MERVHCLKPMRNQKNSHAAKLRLHFLLALTVFGALAIYYSTVQFSQTDLPSQNFKDFVQGALPQDAQLFERGIYTDIRLSIPQRPIQMDTLGFYSHRKKIGIDGRKYINPSVLKVGSKTWISFREHEQMAEYNWWSNTVVGFLTNARNPEYINVYDISLHEKLPAAIKQCFFKQSTHLISGPADARLFEGPKGSLMLSFSYYASVQDWDEKETNCRQLTPYRGSIFIMDLENMVPLEVRIAKPNKLEKNWLFFTGNNSNEIMFVYTIYPHVIFAVNLETGFAKEAYRSWSESLFTNQNPEYHLHLGAGPLSIPESPYLLFVYHAVHVETRKYKNFVYLVDPHPPYKVRCVQQNPLPLSSHEGIIFVSGLSYESGMLYIWYGSDDSESRVYIAEAKEILDDMKCISEPVSLKNITHHNLYWQPDSTLLQGPFNPSIIALPPGSLYPFFAVARAEQTTIEGYYRGEEFSLVESQIIGCVMDVRFHCVRQAEIIPIEYPAEEAALRLWGNRGSYYDTFVGAEDPRLIDGPDGEILMIFNMNSQAHNKTRAMWVVSTHSFEALNWALPKAWLRKRPTNFALPTELEYGMQKEIEKNWAPFVYKNSLHFGYSISPHVILQPSNKAGKYEETHFSTSMSPCLMQISGRLKVNQATPWISFRPCFSGDCITNKMYYLSIFHTRSHGVTNFENYVGIWDGRWPFNLLSIRKLGDDVFSGRSRSFIYVSSLSWLDSVTHGFLDSELLIGYGLGDNLGLVATMHLEHLIGPDLVPKLLRGNLSCIT